MSNKVDWRVRDGFIPTRVFLTGELVRYGNHDQCEVQEILENGALYQIRCFGTKQVYGKDTQYSELQIVNWYSLFKLNSNKETSFTKVQEYRLNQNHRPISGLLLMILGDYAGVDFTPDYQRDYEWNFEDKIKLIDSIFNNISIGLFVLAKVPYKDNAKEYEVIDGKQRLTALQ